MSNRTIQHPPRMEHKPEPHANCMCEHVKHDLRNADMVKLGHTYGASFPAKHIQPVQTVFGTFNVCPACAQDCLQEYMIERA